MDVANAIAVDSSGAAYVAGYTYSTDLPVVDAIQAANAGDCDAFLARLSAGGTTLEYLTYLGGNASDTAAAVAVSAQNVYVAGWTLSTNFPLRNPYQSVVIDNYGAFLTEVDSGLPPVNQGVTPNSGGGASQTFGFQFSDASGTTDLTTVSVLFNSTPAVANACSVVYSRAANSLSLLTDAGGPPAASLTPGSGAQQNTQCVLNGAGSSVSSAGNVLTLNLAISFLPPMAGGPTNIYMQSANLSAATGWGLSGSWTVPAMIVSPSSMSWLPGASEVFQWTGIGSFVECTLSVSAIAAGDTDIFSGVLGSGTSQLVTNLPLNDRPLYVRLGSETSAGWLYVDYVYYAALLTAAGITSPANGSTLSGSTVTFQWSGGVGVSQYWLYASAVAPGGGDLDSINAGAQTSWILTNLPVNASTVYVRLSSLLNGSWRYSDYTYTAAGLSLAAMISPQRLHSAGFHCDLPMVGRGWRLPILALCQQRGPGRPGSLQRQPGNQHIQDVYELTYGRRYDLRPPLVGNRRRLAVFGLHLPKRDGSYPDRAPYHFRRAGFLPGRYSVLQFRLLGLPQLGFCYATHGQHA